MDAPKQQKKLNARSCRWSRSDRTHLPTAELQEDVDVLLIFEVVGELHHVLVRQGSVELDLVHDLPAVGVGGGGL